jgi:hypothetical protein
MKQIPTQTDGLTSLGGADFNQIPSELQTIITASGQTLDGNFTNQASRAIIDLGMNAGFYTDSGTANNVILSNSNNPSPTSLRDGIQVFFKSAATNTGSTTLNLSGLGAKSLVKEDGTKLLQGDLIINKNYECLYDASSDNFKLLNPLKGSIVQRVISSTSTAQTITTTIPTDDTIPQITEGSQVLSATLTPTSLSNIISIEIHVEVLVDQAGRTGATSALFATGSSNAIISSYSSLTGNSTAFIFSFREDFTPTSLSAITFSLRIGADPVTGGNIYINSASNGSRFLGGSRKSYIYLEEIKG